MVSYRITKFDPAKRNEQGAYIDQAEWTAISDVGKPAYGNLTYEEYEKTEIAYVEAVQVILAEKEIECLNIDSLELRSTKRDFKEYHNSGRLRGVEVDFNKDIKRLRNGLPLNQNQIGVMTRLILRETIWMLLVDNSVEVRFGYDYYMYVKCPKLKPVTIKRIEESGLFVEADIAQRKFRFI